MTYEKTLKRLNDFIKNADDSVPTEVFNMVVDCAIAVGLQIPKKPIRDSLDKANLCPICNSSFTFWRGTQVIENKPRYCDACGQAIDWE